MIRIQAHLGLALRATPALVGAARIDGEDRPL
jgi:hypothetical protein